MTIQISDVEAGYLYKTDNNQERVVLGCNVNGKVVYASRGGNVLNNFDHHVPCSVERFAASCSEKLYKVDETRFNEIIESSNAKGVLVADTDCFNPA